MTLWDLLLGVCFCVGVMRALRVARDLGGTLNEYATALGVGLAVGFGSVWALSRLASIIEPRISAAPSKSGKEWSARALYLFAALWIVFAWGLSTRATSGLIDTVVRGR